MIIDFFRRLKHSQTGATAIEYGLIGALIVVAMMVALSGLADTTIGMWNGVATNVLSH